MTPISSTSLPSHFFFFYNDTATTEIYTLSLHDALPICRSPAYIIAHVYAGRGVIYASRPFEENSCARRRKRGTPSLDRKSTRLNSSHVEISYAVFCLKKKKP